MRHRTHSINLLRWGPAHSARAAALAIAILGLAGTASSQTIERITFEEAIRRAVTNNPTIRQAAASILRAESILQQVRAASLPSVDANLTTTVIGPVPAFAGQNIVPRTQLNTNASLAVPLLTPVRWAQRAQAADQVVVSQRTSDDIRQDVAVATAEAYLAVIASHRAVALNEQARDNARAHYEYAQQRFEGGLGSRLNALRAHQELLEDETRVEAARLAVRRAQEALGVLVASNEPIDTAGDPSFDVSSVPTVSNVQNVQSVQNLQNDPNVPNDPIYLRPDLRLFLARESAAERVADDSWREYLPSLTGLFSPQILTPSGLFSPSRSWSAAFVFSVPLFEGGQRRGLQRERRTLVDIIRAERDNTERQARSEIRTAWEAVRSTERAHASARAAADQAQEVLKITDVAFRAGATTNIEVIDAQRRTRDAETVAAIAEDAVRRAKLELLVATGRFPQ